MTENRPGSCSTSQCLPQEAVRQILLDPTLVHSEDIEDSHLVDSGIRHLLPAGKHLCPDVHLYQHNP